MSVIVSDLDLPIVHHVFTRREQREEVKKISEQSWLGKAPIGYISLRHEDCSHILKDNRWHTALGLMSEMNPNLSQEFKDRRKKGLLALNGEDHNRLKRLVTPSFTANSADHLRPFMSSLMTSMLQSSMDKNIFDIQKEIFNYYPIPILCELIGIPKEDWKLFSDWSTLMFTIFNLDAPVESSKVTEAQKQFDDYTENLIKQKTKNPQNDLLSNLIKQEDMGDKLSHEELIMLVEIIIASGIDTTRCQLGLSTRIILENKNIYNQFSEQPKSNSSLVEEIVRVDGVLRGTLRIASEDITYKDILFPKGTLMFLNVVNSNFDSLVFDNPNIISPNRLNLSSKTLSFGAGMHYCLGAALARAEIQEAMTVMSRILFPRIKNWKAEQLPKTSLINGLESLTIEV